MVIFDFTMYSFFDWILLISTILLIPAIYVSLDVYRISRSRSYFFLLGFMIFAFFNSLSNIQLDYTSNFAFLLTGWSNRLAWLFTYLLGFSLLDEAGKKVPKKVRWGYYIFSSLSIAELFFNSIIYPGTNSELQFQFIGLLSKHLHQTIGISTLVIAFIFMTPAKGVQKAKRVRYLWILSMGGWMVFYIIQFLVALYKGIGTSEFLLQITFILNFILYLWIFSVTIFFVITIFLPDNLLITNNSLLIARRVYKDINQKQDSVGFSLTYKSIKNYLESLPSELQNQS